MQNGLESEAGAMAGVRGGVFGGDGGGRATTIPDVGTNGGYAGRRASQGGYADSPLPASFSGRAVVVPPAPSRSPRPPRPPPRPSSCSKPPHQTCGDSSLSMPATETDLIIDVAPGLHPPALGNDPPEVPPRPESTLTAGSHPIVPRSRGDRLPQNRLRGANGGSDSRVPPNQRPHGRSEQRPLASSDSSTSTSIVNLSGENRGGDASTIVSLVQDATTGPASAEIRLDCPRPGPERLQNLYVDTPLKTIAINNHLRQPQNPQQQQLLPKGQGTKSQAAVASSAASAASSATAGRRLPSSSASSFSNRHLLLLSAPSSSPMTSPKQQQGRPLLTSLVASEQFILRSDDAATFAIVKEPRISALPYHCQKISKNAPPKAVSCSGSSSSAPGASLRPPVSGAPQSPSSLSPAQFSASESIICRDCGKCRCEACKAPRKLPEKWLCGNSCLCSANSVVDTLSCMWCLKALKYHCCKDSYGDDGSGIGGGCEDYLSEDDDRGGSGDGSADSGGGRTGSASGGLRDHRSSMLAAVAKWTAVGLLSLFMPCLCCYLPLKACASLTEVTYEACTSNGCRCRPPKQRPPGFSASGNNNNSSSINSSISNSISSSLSSSGSSSSKAGGNEANSSPSSPPVSSSAKHLGPAKRLLDS